jgi:hypothetical protein
MDGVKVTNEYINDRIQLGVTLIMILMLVNFILNVVIISSYHHRLETRFDKIEQATKIEQPNETISL